MLILFASGFYNNSRPPGIDLYMDNPGENEGKEIKISGYVTSVRENSSTIMDPTIERYVIVRNVRLNWKQDDYIALRGIFRKEGYVDFIEGDIIWDKRIKFILSIAGGLVVLFVLIYDRKKIKVSI